MLEIERPRVKVAILSFPEKYKKKNTNKNERGLDTNEPEVDPVATLCIIIERHVAGGAMFCPFCPKTRSASRSTSPTEPNVETQIPKQTCFQTFNWKTVFITPQLLIGNYMLSIISWCNLTKSGIKLELFLPSQYYKNSRLETDLFRNVESGDQGIDSWPLTSLIFENNTILKT